MEDIEINKRAPNIADVTGVSDNCTANPLVVHVSDVSDNNTCPETITRTYSVTDDCGNQILLTQDIIINDVTPPTASNPADIVVPGGPAPARFPLPRARPPMWSRVIAVTCRACLSHSLGTAPRAAGKVMHVNAHVNRAAAHVARRYMRAERNRKLQYSRV